MAPCTLLASLIWCELHGFIVFFVLLLSKIHLRFDNRFNLSQQDAKTRKCSTHTHTHTLEQVHSGSEVSIAPPAQHREAKGRAKGGGRESAHLCWVGNGLCAKHTHEV